MKSELVPIFIIYGGVIIIIFGFLFYFFTYESKKIDNAWKIINEFGNKISNLISIEECNSILKEMDIIFLSKNKDIIIFRLPLQVKKLYQSVYDKKEVLSKSKSDSIYEFIHNDCTWESSYRTVSIHKTKKGAYTEMRKYLMDSYMQWYNDRIIYGKLGHNKCFEDERWSIVTTKLKE